MIWMIAMKLKMSLTNQLRQLQLKIFPLREFYFRQNALILGKYVMPIYKFYNTQYVMMVVPANADLVHV